MEGLMQKHYLHAVLSERVERGARINLTWRWVKKHDRDCIRRRDRASTVPIKLGRQVSEKKAASRAAAQSAAAAVTNNALQMAAASAESAKLSSASARTRLSAGKALTTLRRRLQGRDAAPVASPLPEEGGRERAERSSDARPATVTKAHDAFKRRSDGVRNALDVSNTLDGKIWEKARKLGVVGATSQSGKDAAAGAQPSDRNKSSSRLGSSVSTFPAARLKLK